MLVFSHLFFLHLARVMCSFGAGASLLYTVCTGYGLDPALIRTKPFCSGQVHIQSLANMPSSERDTVCIIYFSLKSQIFLSLSTDAECLISSAFPHLIIPDSTIWGQTVGSWVGFRESHYVPDLQTNGESCTSRKLGFLLLCELKK